MQSSIQETTKHDSCKTKSNEYITYFKLLLINCSNISVRVSYLQVHWYIYSFYSFHFANLSKQHLNYWIWPVVTKMAESLTVP